MTALPALHASMLGPALGFVEAETRLRPCLLLQRQMASGAMPFSHEDRNICAAKALRLTSVPV